MSKKIDMNIIQVIDTYTLSEARKTAVDMITNLKMKNAAKKVHLIRDLQSAPSSKEISRIMWMTVLAGEGLSSVSSNWNSLHA